MALNIHLQTQLTPRVSREPTPTPAPPTFAHHQPPQHPQQTQYPGYAPSPQHHAQGYAHHPPPPGYTDDAAYAAERQMQNTLEASHAEYAREQARAASIMTLHQMFPDLDEEIVEAVLYSCGEDLGVAIDR